MTRCRDIRKIDPGRSAMLGDGSPNHADRVEIGATLLAYDEWAAAGLKSGVGLRDLTFNAHRIDNPYQAQKYGCLMHGVGLCDEWPLVSYPDGFVEGAFDYALEPDMVICVEALVSPKGAISRSSLRIRC